MKKHESYAFDLSNILAQQKALTPIRAEELRKALKHVTPDTYDDFVLEEGFVEKDDLLKALSAYYDVPAFDTEGYFFDHLLLRMFPKDVMIRDGFIPLEVDEETMIIVASVPDDSALPVIINKYVSYDLVLYVGLFRDITDAVKEFFDDALNVDPEIVHGALNQEERAEHEALDIIEGFRKVDES
jgi:hypothetical protein